MLYMILYIVGALAFNQLLRCGQRRETGVLTVVAVNYVVAALTSCGMFLVNKGDWSQLGRWPAPVLGLTNGCLYFTHALILLECYRVAGVGITAALVGAGITVPVLISWFAWGETMTPGRWVAVGLIPVAMFLLRVRQFGPKHLSVKGDVTLFLAFFVAGLIATLHKSVNVYGGEEALPAYQWTLFSATAASSVTYALMRERGRSSPPNGASRSRIPGRDLVLGGVLGTVNSLATVFCLLGLSVVPAVVFYPVSACLIIVANAIVSRILWDERLTERQIAGIGVAGAIVALASV